MSRLIAVLFLLPAMAFAQTVSSQCGTSTSGGIASCLPQIPAGSLVTNVANDAGDNAGACVSDFRVLHGGASDYIGDNTCGLNQTSTSVFNGTDASGIWSIDSIRNCKFSCNAGMSVRFFVYYTPPAALTVTPTSLSFYTAVNTTPAPQSVKITNSGGQSMAWSITSSDAAVAAVPATGNLTPGATVNVSVSVPALSTETSRSATLTINGGALAGARQVSVSYSSYVPCVASQTDPNNCGYCGHVCPSSPNGSATCSSGVCGIACATGYSICGGQCREDVVPILSGYGQCSSDCDCGAKADYWCWQGPNACATTHVFSLPFNLQRTIYFRGNDVETWTPVPEAHGVFLMGDMRDVEFVLPYWFTSYMPSSTGLDMRLLIDGVEAARINGTVASSFRTFDVVARNVTPGHRNVDIEVRTRLFNGPPGQVDLWGGWYSAPTTFTGTVIRR